MKIIRLLIVAVLLLALTGCYAASVDTGRPPSAKVVRQSWASSWIYGLVPPATVQTASLCPGGVARVETRLTFLNQVVSAITFGIYTPMEIVVTCAEEGHAGVTGAEPRILLARDASPEDVRDAFGRAADEAMRTRLPVYVTMR